MIGTEISMPLSSSEMSGFICMQLFLSLSVGRLIISTNISTSIISYISFVMLSMAELKS